MIKLNFEKQTLQSKLSGCPAFPAMDSISTCSHMCKAILLFKQSQAGAPENERSSSMPRYENCLSGSIAQLNDWRR